jgi:hypothetical protein
MATLMTVLTGTILATGKTFTHSLGTTPDICFAVPEQASVTSGTFVYGNAVGVATFDATTVRVGGVIDGTAVRIVCQKIHSIIA